MKNRSRWIALVTITILVDFLIVLFHSPLRETIA